MTNKYVFKLTLSLLLNLVLLVPLTGQDKANTSLQTKDGIISELYDVISGEKGEARDWDYFRTLFRSDAKLIPVREIGDSIYTSTFLSIDDYINRAGPYLEENGFYELEYARSEHCYANICQVFSTYETYRTKNDEKPFARGINSIQLMFDNNRWWIVNIMWQTESEKTPIPDHFLKQ